MVEQVNKFHSFLSPPTFYQLMLKFKILIIKSFLKFIIFLLPESARQLDPGDYSVFSCWELLLYGIPET